MCKEMADIDLEKRRNIKWSPQLEWGEWTLLHLNQQLLVVVRGGPRKSLKPAPPDRSND